MKKNCATIIISHIEDLDGLVSAALVKCYLVQQKCSPSDISIHLTTYSNLPSLIRSYVGVSSSSALYILDLGLNHDVLSEFIRVSSKIKSFHDQTRIYFDHHKFPIFSEPIEDILNQNFNFVVNPYGKTSFSKKISKAESETKRKCTAELIYDYFPVSKSPFWDRLVCYAHLMDFKDGDGDEISQMAQKLNRYITFYQNEEKKLYELLNCMADPFTWEQFLQQLPIAMNFINKWYSDQYSVISQSLKKTSFHGYKIIASWADLRSGEITSYLQKLHPEVEIVLGLSVREKYLNIRTTRKFAHRIAELYGGGGHEDRAGFSLSTLWDAEVLNYSPNQPFPLSVLDDFLKRCAPLLESEG